MRLAQNIMDASKSILKHLHTNCFAMKKILLSNKNKYDKVIFRPPTLVKKSSYFEALLYCFDFQLYTKLTARKFKNMTHIKNEVEYNATMERIEELLLLVNEETPKGDKNSIELVLLSNLVADYDEAHHPISTPTLSDVLKLRMYEMGLTQKEIAEMLGVSPSRISDYLNGRSEPTLPIAREISRKLFIDASIILGV